mmetsp:Transcript_30950/g.71336  ORF Transcript_30950/g.71336 Transcript_30950/m.71336 type:complete len:336 (-) Transcript_30950:51-1058(-)
MGDIVVRHGQDGNLCDGPSAANHTTGALVNGRQVSVHVTRVTTATGHLLAGSGHLTQSVGVRGHVCENDKHVLVALVCEVLSHRQGKTGGDDTLDRGVVSQVQEQAHVLHGSVLLEVLLEKASSLHVHTHSREHNSEVGAAVVTRLLHQTGLSANLGCDFIVGETGSGEKRNLLPTSNAVHGINGGDSSLDHLLRVGALGRVDGLTSDVVVILCQDIGTLVNGLAGTVENTAKHVLRHRNLERLTRELNVSVHIINTLSALKHLHDGLLACNFKNLTALLGSITKSQVDNLGVHRELHMLQNDQRTGDSLHSAVLEARLHSVRLLGGTVRDGGRI